MIRPASANRHPRTAYLASLLVQIAGAGCIVWTALPIFLTLADRPGDQISRHMDDYIILCLSILVMQFAYWYGLFRIPVPFARPNILLNHVVAFAGRLSFVFGAAMFSLGFFRHLPALGSSVDPILFIGQGVLLACALFALFCLALEFERLADALAPKP